MAGGEQFRGKMQDLDLSLRSPMGNSMCERGDQFYIDQIARRISLVSRG